MEIKNNKKNMIFLGVRIGLVFLMTVVMIISVAYYTLTQNFHNLLTDYTIKLVQSMVGQGAKTIEYELEIGQKEASILASSFHISISENKEIEFPEIFNEKDRLRIIYTSKNGTIASDGRKRDVWGREDIISSFNKGETTVYGPYFNEENEYVVCYSAPVKKNGNIVGVASIEKNGYRFCNLILNMNFINSGESYIINEKGTDIAVSNLEHIDWVNSEYNSQKIYQETGDTETKSVMDLELKGLRGETGYGTYYWYGKLCYVVYVPIPSANWVLLTGLKEEEMISLTQSALFASISKGPILMICFVLFLLLTGLIIFWIISSVKKNAEINHNLEIIANHDSLTGLLNRRFLETTLTKLWNEPSKAFSPAAVFMLDLDNFKKYNDFYGHQEGDDCLRRVANVFKDSFEDYNGNVIRYGGEEFVAVIFSVNHQTVLELGQKICQLVENEKLVDGQGGFVTVSVGICYANTTREVSLYNCIKVADKALYQAKKNGKNRAVILKAL